MELEKLKAKHATGLCAYYGKQLDEISDYETRLFIGLKSDFESRTAILHK